MGFKPGVRFAQAVYAVVSGAGVAVLPHTVVMAAKVSVQPQNVELKLGASFAQMVNAVASGAGVETLCILR